MFSTDNSNYIMPSLVCALFVHSLLHDMDCLHSLYSLTTLHYMYTCIHAVGEPPDLTKKLFKFK